MKYLTRSEYGIKVDEKTLRSGMIEYINKLCLEVLATYIGRKQSAIVTLSIKSLIPVYISSNAVLFPTHSVRNSDCFFVNYCRVLSVIDEGKGRSKILFDDLTSILVNQTDKKILKQMRKSERIKNHFYKVNVWKESVYTMLLSLAFYSKVLYNMCDK